MYEMTYSDYKAFLEDHLLDCLPEIDPKSITLYEAMKYSLTAGGKRLRPILLLATCEFCGGDIKTALPYALAIEYIHTYSLIHDDLPAMDNDDLRRGVPTNHKVYGEAMAILAGDGLLNTAFEAMNKDMLLYFDEASCLKCRVKASYEIAKGAGCRGMVAGQVADIEVVSKNACGELLDYIHVNKTGALIMAAIRAGAHLGNADEETLRIFSDYGELVGLAYQITDDILDVEGDESVMGKEAGHDEKTSKCTYVTINGLEKSKAKVKELTESALELMKPYYDNAEFFNTLAIDLQNRVE
ncbi:MAG: polyprenyl synthetase family protein [Clostridia bacterium]|jgi:geranylgeranyl diphosphate synthase type II|nr:polyprenyl synthetase family protein [Clostridia bacterium]